MGSHRRIYGELYQRDIVPVAYLSSGCGHPLVCFKMAYEYIYGIRLDERETEAHIRQKAAAQQRLRSFPQGYVHGSKSSA